MIFFVCIRHIHYRKPTIVSINMYRPLLIAADNNVPKIGQRDTIFSFALNKQSWVGNHRLDRSEFLFVTSPQCFVGMHKNLVFEVGVKVRSELTYGTERYEVHTKKQSQ